MLSRGPGKSGYPSVERTEEREHREDRRVEEEDDDGEQGNKGTREGTTRKQGKPVTSHSLVSVENVAEGVQG